VRNWLARFWVEFQKQLNIIAGVAALGAFPLAVAGFLAEGLLRTGLIGLGGFIFAVTVIVSVKQAWPAAHPHPKDYLGNDIGIPLLEALEPPPLKIGIVGRGAVGKTTLLMRLLQQPDDIPQTTQIRARISRLVGSDATYIALLEGRGEYHPDQHEILEHSECLILLMDHNDIPGQGVIGNKRLDNHRNLSQDLRTNATERKLSFKIHLLLNKRDEWSAAQPNTVAELRAFFADEVQQWVGVLGAAAVTSAEHSNTSSVDIAALSSVILRYMSEAKEQRSQGD
jgi:GTPase SAR1 family protein